MDRIPLAYTFGNHMHWVDMEWLWGYDVLRGSVDDMLAFCERTGARGCLNFDGIGIEKLAAESPEHIIKLKEALAKGQIEVVGGSYGQPYGLFHGGESNIRQRVYGVRTFLNVLGVRPRTFWEEEFDFHPQLPQILAGCGFTGASVYFQWTWHTPEIPMSDHPVVAWEGLDGTAIPTATRNRLNLHQWPEDFQLLLDDLAKNPPETEDGIPPLVLQWLELMPSRDWMCRGELMAPMLESLKSDPRFELICQTLGDYLSRWNDRELPRWTPAMDDVWHGMTLGKNGDNHPKTSALLENRLLREEAAAAMLGLFGRPYEPWDVYPTWELEECWRQLLAAQHHDNHECEGLCGHVAEAQFAFVEELLRRSSNIHRLAKRTSSEGREVRIAFGASSVGWSNEPGRRFGFWQSERSLVIGGAKLSLTIGLPDGTRKELDPVFEIDDEWRLQAEYEGVGTIALREARDGLTEVEVILYQRGALEPGYGGSVQLEWELPPGQVFAEVPYGVVEVGDGSSGRRKYPQGDWMTSPQWFESVSGAFTSSSFILMQGKGAQSLLIAHSGSQQWFRRGSKLSCILLSRDPWDGAKEALPVWTVFLVAQGDGLDINGSSSLAADARSRIEPWISPSGSREGELPPQFTAVQATPANVQVGAFFREQASQAGRHLPGYAKLETEHPYVLRLVERTGQACDAVVTLAGPVAKAVKTNMMGEAIQELEVFPGDDSILSEDFEFLAKFGLSANEIRLPLRPFEIATIYLDIIPGRKQYRDLDAKREIWATVHRT